MTTTDHIGHNNTDGGQSSAIENFIHNSVYTPRIPETIQAMQAMMTAPNVDQTVALRSGILSFGPPEIPVQREAAPLAENRREGKKESEVAVNFQLPAKDKTPDEKAVDEFQKDFDALLAERNPEKRSALLKNLRNNADDLGSKILPILINKMDDDDYHARRQAMDLITNGVGPDALRALKDTAKTSDSLELRKNCEEATKTISASDRGKLAIAIDEKVPLAVRERIESVLAKKDLDKNDLATLKEMAPHANLLVMQELLKMTKRDGDDALSSPRGTNLLAALKSMGKDAAPSLYLAADNPDFSSKPLKEFAEKQIQELSNAGDKNTGYVHPDAWLYDLRGNLRAAGKDFEANYDRHGALKKVRTGENEFEDAGFGKVKVTNTRVKDSRIIDDVTSFTATPDIKTEKGFAGVDVRVNFGTGSSHSIGSTMWRSPELDKQVKEIWEKYNSGK